jgi:pilus assembly protein Flp/PilA
MLPELKRRVIAFLKEEDGPTAVEYAVMLALIIVVCTTAVAMLGENTNSSFSNPTLVDNLKPTAS